MSFLLNPYIINSASSDIGAGSAAAAGGALGAAEALAETSASAAGTGDASALGGYIGDFASVDSDESVSDLSTYTFSSINIGAEDSQRLVIVSLAYGYSSTRTISSVTINGVGATIHSQINLSTQLRGAAIASAVVTTGTSVTISVVASGTCTRMLMEVYRAVPFDTTVLDTVSGSATTNVSSRTLSDLEVAAGGFFVSVAVGAATTGLSASYNGNDGITVNNNTNTAEGVGRYVFVSAATSESNATRDLTYTWSSGSSALGVVAVSWAPA